MTIIFSANESMANRCPTCSGDKLDYGVWDSPVPGGEIRYIFICMDCGATGEEIGELVFDGHDIVDSPDSSTEHHYDKDSSKPDICPLCGCDSLAFDGDEISQDEHFLYNWECPCGAKGRECYFVEFRGYEMSAPVDALHTPPIFSVVVEYTGEFDLMENVAIYNFLRLNAEINCEEALRSAIKEYLSSEDGKNTFPPTRIPGWSEFIRHVPNEFYVRHGLRLLLGHKEFRIGNWTNLPGREGDDE